MKCSATMVSCRYCAVIVSLLLALWPQKRPTFQRHWHCGHKKWHDTWPLYAIELLSNCRFVLSGYHKNRWGVGEKSFLCRSPLWTKESKPFDFLSRSKQPILIKFGASIPWHQLYYYTFQISEISDHFMAIWKNTRFSYGDLLWTIVSFLLL